VGDYKRRSKVLPLTLSPLKSGERGQVAVALLDRVRRTQSAAHEQEAGAGDLRRLDQRMDRRQSARDDPLVGARGVEDGAHRQLGIGALRQ
jgi:hypothetical protein